MTPGFAIACPHGSPSLASQGGIPMAFPRHLCGHRGGFPPPQAAHRQVHLQRRILTILLPKSQPFPPCHPNSAGWRALFFSLLSHSSYQQPLPCLPRGCGNTTGSLGFPMPLKPAMNTPPHPCKATPARPLHSPGLQAHRGPELQGYLGSHEAHRARGALFWKRLKHLHRIHGRSGAF